MQNFMKGRHSNKCQDGTAVHKSLCEEREATQIEFKVIFFTKDVKSALFLSKLVISHSVVCTSVVNVGCIRINQQSSYLKALIQSTKMFYPLKGEAVWVIFSLTSRTRLSADLSVVITYRGLSDFSSKSELHEFVFQRLSDNAYLA
jgi:hypothetical protein